MTYTPNDVAWTDSPDDNQKSSAYELKRCPATGSHNALILSTKLMGVKVHYWHGRTRPHLTHDCAACHDKSPWRWRGYLACAHPTKLTRFALEVTAPCVNAIEDYAKTYQTLRGALITLQRPSGKPNGRITCELNPAPPPTGGLPPEFDLQTLMLKLWEIQTSGQVNRVADLLNTFELNGNEES